MTDKNVGIEVQKTRKDVETIRTEERGVVEGWKDELRCFEYSIVTSSHNINDNNMLRRH